MSRTEGSATASSPVERLGRRDIVAVVVLVLAAVGIPLAMAVAAGAVGLPSNDDWVYTHAANGLFDTGRVDMAGHTTAFVGQLALVQPFLWLSGGHPWAFTAFELVMTSIGIACTYLLARRFVGIASAVVVVLLILAFPGFARSSATFMTDVPTYALMMLCLLLGTRWLQDDGGRVGLHRVSGRRPARGQHPRVRPGGTHRDPGRRVGSEPAAGAGLAGRCLDRPCRRTGRGRLPRRRPSRGMARPRH